jgi:Dna[CI] antecedent, DciA
MHKKSLRDKKTGAQKRRQRTYAPRRSAPHDYVSLKPYVTTKSINELLSNRAGLRQITASIPIQQSWAEWLRATVAAELAGHIVSAVPKNDELVVFADTAAWGTRLRYALAAVLADISGRDAAVTRITVRVQR